MTETESPNTISESAVLGGRLDDVERTLKHHFALIEDGGDMCRHRRDDAAQMIGRNRGEVDKHVDRLGQRVTALETRLVGLAVLASVIFIVAVVAVTALVLAAQR